MSGMEAFFPAMLASVFVGMFGGFIVQFAAGLLAGAAAWWVAKPNAARVKNYAAAFSAIGAVPGVVLLAILAQPLGGS